MFHYRRHALVSLLSTVLATFISYLPIKSHAAWNLHPQYPSESQLTVLGSSVAMMMQ